jgi:hypothetical protein
VVLQEEVAAREHRYVDRPAGVPDPLPGLRDRGQRVVVADQYGDRTAQLASPVWRYVSMAR